MQPRTTEWRRRNNAAHFNRQGVRVGKAVLFIDNEGNGGGGPCSVSFRRGQDEQKRHHDISTSVAVVNPTLRRTYRQWDELGQATRFGRGFDSIRFDWTIYCKARSKKTTWSWKTSGSQGNKHNQVHGGSAQLPQLVAGSPPLFAPPRQNKRRSSHNSRFPLATSLYRVAEAERVSYRNMVGHNEPQKNQDGTVGQTLRRHHKRDPTKLAKPFNSTKLTQEVPHLTVSVIAHQNTGIT